MITDKEERYTFWITLAFISALFVLGFCELVFG